MIKVSKPAGTGVPGLLEVLAQVPVPRRKRGRRFRLVFVLAVAAVCTLAGARGFRELGDQAGLRYGRKWPMFPSLADLS
jgi:hypothetical protein